MKNNKKISLISLLLLLFANFLLAAEVDRKPVDLRILIDISHEVKTTFPSAAHLEILELLIDRLPAGSRAGVWTYGKYVNHLVQRGLVNQRWKEQAKQQLKSVKSVALNRNIGFVMRQSSFDVNQPDSSYQPVILLLSAGDINLFKDASRNKLERYDLLNKLLPKLRKAGFIIHTLALTEKSDQQLLAALAKETGGLTYKATSSEKMYQAVVDLADLLAPQNYIPIIDNEVAVDADVKAFTAMLIGVGENTQKSLKAPNGKQLGWQGSNQHVLIRVEKPEMGRWKLPAGLSELSRVYTESTQRFLVEPVQTNYVVGERPAIEAHLTYPPGKGYGNEVDVLLKVQGAEPSLQRLSQAEQGYYEGQINSFNEPGTFRVGLRAQALDYSRALDYPVQVHQLINIDVHTQELNGQKDYLIDVAPVDTDLDLIASTLIATVTDSKGEWKVRTASLSEQNHWLLQLADDGVSTEYKVELDFKGVTFTGREVRFKPKPMLIELRSAASPVEIKETIEEVIEEDADQVSQPIWLIIIAGTGLVLSLLLIGVYLFKNRKSGKHPETSNELASAEPEPEPEPEKSDIAASGIKPVFEEESTELEVEIELDEALQEETALAEEWSQLDAQATLSQEPYETTQEESGTDDQGDDDFHIEIAFDDLEDELDSESTSSLEEKKD